MILDKNFIESELESKVCINSSSLPHLIRNRNLRKHKRSFENATRMYLRWPTFERRDREES